MVDIRTGRRPGPQRMLRGRPPGPGAPPDFEKVFENEFGSLWRNPAEPQHSRQHERATLPLPLLVLVAIAGLALVTCDLVPAPPLRLRRFLPVGSVVTVALCLAPLARTAVTELRNPPVPAQSAFGRTGGPGPRGPGRPERPPRGPGVGEEPGREDIRRQHEMVHAALRLHLENGMSPDYFWPPEREDELRRLMEQGRVREADRLLRDALMAVAEVLREGGAESVPALPAAPRDPPGPRPR